MNGERDDRVDLEESGDAAGRGAGVGDVAGDALDGYRNLGNGAGKRIDGVVRDAAVDACGVRLAFAGGVNGHLGSP